MSKFLECAFSERGGFVFDNVARNEFLVSKTSATGNAAHPKFRKTGTTICGCLFDGGVVLGADTRATQGDIVADKECDKLHRLSSSIWMAGAGTSADLDQTAALLASNLELHRMTTRRAPRVCTAVSILSHMLFRYGGHIGCAVVIGGVDPTGTHLYKVHPHGSSDRLPFCAMGSGSFNALAFLEARFKDDLPCDAATELVADAISSGISNDLGSGGAVDVVVLRSGTAAADHKRTFRTAHPEKFRMPKPVEFRIGGTPVLAERVEKLISSGSVEVVDTEMTVT